MTRMIALLTELIFFCLAALAFSTSAQAEQAPFRVGLFNMPPFYSQSPSGQPEGELIEVLNKVMAHLGYRWQPKFMPVPQALREVVNGEVDLLMIIRHPMVEGRAIYGDEPMSSMDLLAFHRQDSAVVSDVSGLRGYRVALLRGYGYGGLLNQLLAPSSDLKIHMVEDHRDAFSLLESKQVDYVLNYLAPGVRTLTQMGLQNIESDLLQKKNVYFVLSSKVAEGARLMSELENSMRELDL